MDVSFVVVGWGWSGSHHHVHTQEEEESDEEEAAAAAPSKAAPMEVVAEEEEEAAAPAAGSKKKPSAAEEVRRVCACVLVFRPHPSTSLGSISAPTRTPTDAPAPGAQALAGEEDGQGQEGLHGVHLLHPEPQP